MTKLSLSFFTEDLCDKIYALPNVAYNLETSLKVHCLVLSSSYYLTYISVDYYD